MRVANNCGYVKSVPSVETWASCEPAWCTWHISVSTRPRLVYQSLLTERSCRRTINPTLLVAERMTWFLYVFSFIILLWNLNPRWPRSVGVQWGSVGEHRSNSIEVQGHVLKFFKFWRVGVAHHGQSSSPSSFTLNLQQNYCFRLNKENQHDRLQ